MSSSTSRVLRLLPFAALLLLYGALGAKDWGPHDSSEIAAGAARLGIVHPPGYPLYLLLGHLLFRLAGLPGILLLSIVPATIALFLLARLAEKEGADPLSGVAGVVVIGLSPLLLDMALQIEVYACHLLLLVLLETTIRDLDRRAPAFFLLLGLSLSHHIGVLILLPAYLPEIAAWSARRARAGAALGTAATGALVVPPLALYLLLPLYSRAQTEFLSWGPVTWDGLFHYATGGPFRVWMFRDPPAVGIARALDATRILFENLPILLWLLAAWGFAAGPASRSVRLRAVWFLLVPILHLGAYSVIDLGPFLTPALVPLGLCLSHGIDRVRARIPATFASSIPFLAGALALLAAWQNPSLLSYRSDYLARYGRTILAAYPENTRILANWRYFPLLRALQLVEGRGVGARVVLAGSDTSAVSPGDVVLTPSRARGRTQALLFDGLAWRVAEANAIETAVLSPGAASETVHDIGGGMAVLGAELPDRARVGDSATLRGRIAFVRGESTPRDEPESSAATLWLVLSTTDHRDVYRLPLDPIAWNLRADRWETSVVYFEPVGALLSTHLAVGRYEWILRRETRDGTRDMPLSPLEIGR